VNVSYKEQISLANRETVAGKERNAAASRNSTPLALGDFVFAWRDRLSESTCLDSISKLIISLLHNDSYNNPNTNTLRTAKCCRGYHNSSSIAPSPPRQTRPYHAMYCKSGRHRTHYTSRDIDGVTWGAGGLDDSARCKKEKGGNGSCKFG